MMIRSALGRLLLEAIDRLGARRWPQRRPIQAVCQQAIDIKVRYAVLETPHNPTRDAQRRLGRGLGQKLIGVPADPSIALLNLDDRATESCDADDRMIGSSAVADEEEHGSARRARVVVAPGM